MIVEVDVIDPLDAELEPAHPGRLRVCLVLPQSGVLGMIGPSSMDAALLAAHEVNVAGGANGRRVELVLVDGGGEPSAVARQVRQLCGLRAVDVVAGIHTSDVHRAVEQVVARRTPYLFTPPHEGGSRQPGVVCLGADPWQQLRHSIGWLAEQHRLSRWALVGNDYIWPRTVHAVARRLVAHTSGQVVLEQRLALGGVAPSLDRLVDALVSSRADAVLLSLVGRDLVTVNAALRHAGLDNKLVRLSGSLEENGLLALGGDDTGTLYAAMRSFSSLCDERRLALHERHATLFGPRAPVVDTYAEGVYDGMHLMSSLATEGTLTPDLLAPAIERHLEGGRHERIHLARAVGLDFEVVDTGPTTSIWN